MEMLEHILVNNSAFFHPVVPFHPGKDKLLQLHFTHDNNELTEDILRDTNRFTDYINSKLQRANARYGIGGYGEHRTIYSRSEIFGPGEGTGMDPEPRRLHLGVDIWGKPCTRVMAPLDGFVHSFAFQQAFGDYGAVMILTHQLDGHSFYTLYGHLSLASIRNLHEGDRIKMGEVFAEFGIPQENGNWPPHLHFQIIKDLEGKKGDYPGVCRYSEKEQYLLNCPDPDLILSMNQYIAEK
jgi:murein DD-endopeptidase MepM/ murein hydrolase activator NlpD